MYVCKAIFVSIDSPSTSSRVGGVQDSALLHVDSDTAAYDARGLLGRSPVNYQLTIRSQYTIMRPTML